MQIAKIANKKEKVIVINVIVKNLIFTNYLKRILYNLI